MSLSVVTQPFLIPSLPAVAEEVLPVSTPQPLVPSAGALHSSLEASFVWCLHLGQTLLGEELHCAHLCNPGTMSSTWHLMHICCWINQRASIVNDQVPHTYHYYKNFGQENRTRREACQLLFKAVNVCCFLPWILINYPCLFDQTSR